MKAKRALITGITGQDGSYLAELLLGKGYSVAGVTSGKSPHDNIHSFEGKISLITGNISDKNFLYSLLREQSPDEIYNLASVATVARPWENVPEVVDTAALVPLHFLEGIRNINPHIRFFQASSAEMYGTPVESPQNEDTPFHPRNPYGVAKVFAHHMIENYRAHHSLFAVSGILFNHESPRRSVGFVTRKITSTVAKIKKGVASELPLGDLAMRRDWGYAGDYVEAMWLMLQQETPKDFVIATGETHSVQEFVDAAFSSLGIDWKKYVTKDATLVRPPEPVQLVGDASRARKELRWEPKVKFDELVKMMVDADLEASE